MSQSPNLILVLTRLMIYRCREFISQAAHYFQLDITDEIAELVALNSPIVVSISGGKDSDCLAILVDRFLSSIDFSGPKLLIHSDLGEIEHAESLDQVKQLATFLGWNLEIVRREKGGLLERYEQRWHDNLVRFANLNCVNLISPFPSPNLGRFCTSELKISPITQKIAKLFPSQTIINCTGIRAEESSARSKNAISKQNPKLSRSHNTKGYDWLAILNTKIERVWLVHREAAFTAHPQYARGNSRISCSFCFLASLNDWICGAAVPTNHKAYRQLTNLEIRSGFSYQQSRWLADIRPDLVPYENSLEAIAEAKAKAEFRRQIELTIPSRLLFANHGGRQGWPASQPSLEDCEQIALARQQLKDLMGKEIRTTTGLDVLYTTAREVYQRYAQLLTEKESLDQRRRHRVAVRERPTKMKRQPQPASVRTTAQHLLIQPTMYTQIQTGAQH